MIGLARTNVFLFRPEATGNPLNPLTGERISYWLRNADEQQYFLTAGAGESFFDGVIYCTILRDPIDLLFSQEVVNKCLRTERT